MIYFSVGSGDSFQTSRAKRLQQRFPRLVPGTYRRLASETSQYNCIAWAVRNRDAFWWPGTPGYSYWPPNLPTEPTLENFIKLFQSFGYKTCTNADFEKGFEKVAIFAKDDQVTHVARQLWNGRWSSKLGHWELIEHDLDAVAGQAYGEIEQVMSRKRTIRRIIADAVAHFLALRLKLRRR
jgi:hypothetical protein